MTTVDLDRVSIRELNQRLHQLPRHADELTWQIISPRGKHAIAVGLDAAATVVIEGHVGYYCGGMNKRAAIRVHGHAGPGVAENMMSGSMRVTGNAGQAAGASGCGGLLVVDGDASSRCGISMKGIDIVVGGSVGHMSAFMAQAGHLVVCGDAGAGLGDSLYEAVIYVRGHVDRLGSDCVEKDVSSAQRQRLAGVLQAAAMDHDPASFRRYGSARRLYNFHVDHAAEY